MSTSSNDRTEAGKALALRLLGLFPADEQQEAILDLVQGCFLELFMARYSAAEIATFFYAVADHLAVVAAPDDVHATPVAGG